jgi:DNA-binding LytR/AlgR family response regulator
MLNITICDDERTEREYLQTLTRKWAADCPIHLREYGCAESFLFAYEEDKSTDILLLDIQMKKMDGVTLAKKIRAGNKEIQIIFVTGYMDYIADGYDVEALHYLLKPVTEEKLFAILDRAKDKLARNERALFVTHGGMKTRIPLYEIRCVEVRHNYVTIYAEAEYTVKMTLNEIEKECDDSFFRAGRSYIVNLRCIKKCSKSEIHLKDGMVIPLSRGLYDALNRAMIERL